MTDKLSPIQDELLKRADSIFSSISTAVGQAKDLAVEQLPDIAYQFVAYNRAYLTFIVLFAIICFVAVQVITIKFGNRTCKSNYGSSKDRWDFEQYMPWIFATVTSTVVFGGIFLANLKDLFMVWFAPKIFLIEQIVQLVKH